MSLFILSVVVVSLIQTLPKLVVLSRQIEVDQLIKSNLYHISDQLLNKQHEPFDVLTFTTPIPYVITSEEAQMCASYTWENANEFKFCVPK